MSCLGTHNSNTPTLYESAKLDARKEHVRESWVRSMEAKIVRDNLTKCYRMEGVNAPEKCKHLAERYAEMIEQNRVSIVFLQCFWHLSDTLPGPGIQKD